MVFARILSLESISFDHIFLIIDVKYQHISPAISENGSKIKNSLPGFKFNPKFHGMVRKINFGSPIC